MLAPISPNSPKAGKKRTLAKEASVFLFNKASTKKSDENATPAPAHSTNSYLTGGGKRSAARRATSTKSKGRGSIKRGSSRKGSPNPFDVFSIMKDQTREINQINKTPPSTKQNGNMAEEKEETSFTSATMTTTSTVIATTAPTVSNVITTKENGVQSSKKKINNRSAVKKSGRKI
jgi:hypothetical protein